MNKKEILAKLEEQASKTETKKLGIKEVSALLDFVDTSEEDRVAIINHLEDNGLLVTTKGFSSMSAIQKQIHRFINDTLLGDLMKNGKSTIVVSPEDLKSLVSEASGNGEKYYVLNKKGDLIKPSCNNTNITEQRKVRELKAMQEQMTK